ncbi:hypothetical protein A6769_35295 [Nostoc punctiforme NIES-2108]|uniref:Uncharacterized protein n=1 Tax=Nostoc punctiforme NIES-2108 TaxID=1356359 RepID=A0A367R0R5_NOSPU|nr:hypothetical protein A6769_35295 [Nostoc punctiforme NIES-2108]
MPDGDIFHSELSGIYQKSYRILCEGKLERNECARITTQAFLKDIKKKGAAPIVIAKGMGKLLTQVTEHTGENRSVDWTALSKKLDRLAQQANIPNRAKSLVLDAGKSVLHDFRYGQKADASAIQELVIERYMQKVYLSSFEERIPLTRNHHAKVDHATVTERVEALQPDIFAQIHKWARKANDDEDVANLRRTRRSTIKEIDLDEDLL